MTHLDLSGNDFHTLPPELSQAKAVTHLNLSGSNVGLAEDGSSDGPLPEWVYTFKLKELILTDCGKLNDVRLVITLVPIRPRSRGARRSLLKTYYTFPIASFRPRHGFNPRLRYLSTPFLTPFNNSTDRRRAISQPRDAQHRRHAVFELEVRVHQVRRAEEPQDDQREEPARARRPPGGTRAVHIAGEPRRLRLQLHFAPVDVYEQGAGARDEAQGAFYTKVFHPSIGFNT